MILKINGMINACKVKFNQNDQVSIKVCTSGAIEKLCLNEKNMKIKFNIKNLSLSQIGNNLKRYVESKVVIFLFDDMKCRLMYKDDLLLDEDNSFKA
jgi:hypothetical protein